MNQLLFHQNNLTQETTALGPPQGAPQGSASRFATVGQRSLSAPGSDQPAPAVDLRKYMPAGARVAARGGAVDVMTGLVSMGGGQANGVWSTMVDASAQGGAGGEPARRMRGRGSAPAPVSAEDLALADKMRWNPEAEAAAAARRAAASAAWEGGGAASAVPVSPQQEPPRATGKRQGGGATGSLSLGWTEEVAAHEPRSAEKQAQLSARPGGGGASAPWARENPSESGQGGRRAVEGKDSQRSKITWQGYGKNDPVKIK
jgi:hypothetical protein